MNFIRLLRALALATTIFGPCAASAAVSTTPVTLSATAWTDLGAGPMLVSASGGRIVYVVADAGTTVPLVTAGHALGPQDPPAVIETTQHVYALALAPVYGSGTALVSPISTWSGANLTTIGGVAISTGAGATDSGTQRVVLATGGATQATVAPGTAPANATVVGGVYTATAPSPSDGQTMAVRLDAGGNLKVAAAIGAPNKASATYSSIASNAVTTIAARATRHAITVLNTGTADLCDVASAAATSCTGNYSRIRPGVSKTFDYTGAIYLISASGTGSAESDETYF